MTTENSFTPALGNKKLTPAYDLAIALLTREREWRGRFVEQIAPMSNDRIIDVGCGTGSLAIMLKSCAPDARVTGVDPDPVVLARARAKSGRRGVEISWQTGFLTDALAEQLTPVTKVVSSLVLHQTPLDEKLRILRRMHQLLQPDGELHIADYGLQRSKIMRILFRRTVQAIDGIEDTQPNADGVLPELILSAGFASVRETRIIPTITGSISLYRAARPATSDLHEIEDMDTSRPPIP